MSSVRFQCIVRARAGDSPSSIQQTPNAMAVNADACENMCAEVETTLLSLAESIRAQDARLGQLRTFPARIETMPDCFTAVETNATRAHIEHETAQRAALCALLEEKVLVYEQRVLNLHSKMSQRRDAIDSNSGLESVPDLLEVFVQQQATYSKELDEAHRFLIS